MYLFLRNVFSFEMRAYLVMKIGIVLEFHFSKCGPSKKVVSLNLRKQIFDFGKNVASSQRAYAIWDANNGNILYYYIQYRYSKLYHAVMHTIVVLICYSSLLQLIKIFKTAFLCANARQKSDASILK